MDFVAIDVETANAKMASICQIGVAQFSAGRLVEEWKSYVDPEDHFDGINVSIHGIDESMIAGAPTFRAIAGTLGGFLLNRIVVSHMPFDRIAIGQASSKYLTPLPSCRWLDSARVVRRTWPEFANSGYGLTNICESIGYKYKSHDALEDAKAAAAVLLAAIDKSGLSLDAWMLRAQQPIDLTVVKDVARQGNPEGPLYGAVLVFTGALNISRSEAAGLAARAGCNIDSAVTKRTTLLVVGDQDVLRLAGYNKSTKHRKAEELIAKGQAIRIIQETDFLELTNLSR